MSETTSSFGKIQLAAPEEVLRLRHGVARVRRAGGETVLVAPKGNAIRVSPVSECILPLLTQGAPYQELASRLIERYPTAAGDVDRKLRLFLSQMERSGFLESRAPARPVRRLARLELGNPDPLARVLADALGRLPRWLARGLGALLAAAAIAGLVALVVSPVRVHPLDLVRQFDPLGLALFFLLVLPLHELAHAVACRVAGVPVSGFGIVLHGNVFPGPYMDTSQSYRVAGRWHRFWIPGAGPLINFLAAGAAAWGVVATGGTGLLGIALRSLLLLCLLFLYLDTNPLTPSDGSHMLEAALDDELARAAALGRRSTRLSPWKTVALYRTAASLHVEIAAVLLWWAW